MSANLSRRALLASVPLAMTANLVVGSEHVRPPAEPFEYCFNTSTIQGQKLSVVEEVDIVAKAGYKGFEPWIRELEAFTQSGGSLKDLAKRIADHGLIVPSAIGFPSWIVDNEGKRKKGLDDAKRAMEMVQILGCPRLAAPPVGATDRSDVPLLKAAERYRTLAELGEQFGVTPMVEMWGHSKTLSRLGEAALVATESGHKNACVLADVYHLYKGGSDFVGVKLLSGVAMPHFHLNDYPADPSRAAMTDAHRVYPGDGVAPLKQLLRDLQALGFRGMLSLELFNRDYWKQDPAQVAKTGLEKMRAVVRAAFG